MPNRRNPIPRVLVVDDDELTLDMMRWAFKDCPFEAVFCLSGVDAMALLFKELAEGRFFDAYLFDCALPFFDGFSMAKIVRLCEATGVCKRGKIAFFTAFPQTVERSSLVEEAGADLYLRKPQDAAELPETVTKWLMKELDGGAACGEIHMEG
jgi:DNA-binding response OmpR family regulator